jgi:hypothetical protein
MLPPPKGYQSWVEFAAKNVPTRDLFNSHAAGEQPQWEGHNVTRDRMRQAAEHDYNVLNLLHRAFANQWTCKKCRRVLDIKDWTYRQLAEDGVPVCCDQDMTLD